MFQIFFDDSVRNIQSGKCIGLHAVLVNLIMPKTLLGAIVLLIVFAHSLMQIGTSYRVKGADHALESIHNIREALPELWEEADKSNSIRHSSKVAIETRVTA